LTALVASHLAISLRTGSQLAGGLAISAGNGAKVICTTDPLA
jgi:hypothetical protein